MMFIVNAQWLILALRGVNERGKSMQVDIIAMLTFSERWRFISLQNEEKRLQ